MRYDPKVFKKLEEYKDTIVNACQDCGGNGYLLNAGNKNTYPACECMQVFKYVAKLVVAGIPSEYWRLDLSSLVIPNAVRSILSKYLEYFDNAVKKHKGLLFLGKNGVGKTAVMCEIGKYAVAHKYKVKFFLFEDFVNAACEGNKEFMDDLNNYDIHLMDEFGKGYMKEGSTFIPSKVEAYIKRTIADKTLILSTNFTWEELEDLLGDSVMSAVKRQIHGLVIDGSDYSDQRELDWATDLKTPFDWRHPHIMKYAKEFR